MSTPNESDSEARPATPQQQQQRPLISRQTTIATLRRILASRRSYLAARTQAIATPTVEATRERREIETEIHALEHALSLIGDSQHDWL